MTTVKSRAHRTITKFQNFTTDTEESDLFLSLVEKKMFEDGGELIGVYFNEYTQPFFSIGVFERGLLVCDPDLLNGTSSN